MKPDTKMLRKGALSILRYGWWDGGAVRKGASLEGSRLPRCVLESLWLQVNSDLLNPDYISAQARLKEFTKANDLARWNDAPQRKRRHVIWAMLRA